MASSESYLYWTREELIAALEAHSPVPRGDTGESAGVTDGPVFQTEDLCRNVFNVLSEGLCVLDREHHIQSANRSILDLFGGDEPIEGKFCYQVFMNRTAPCPGCIGDRAIRSGQRQQRLICIPVHGGEKRWFEIHLYPLDGKDGNRVVKKFRDITHIMTAEEELQRFRMAVDMSADCLALIDRSTLEIIDVNKTAEDALGYSRAELTALGFEALAPRLTTKQVADLFDVIIRSETSTIVNTVFQRRDGSEFPVEIAFRSIQFDRHPVIVAIARDETERIRSMDLLNERLRVEHGISACSRALLGGIASGDPMQEGLIALLEASGAARVYFFEKYVDPVDGICVRKTHEACAPGIPPANDNPVLKHIPSKGLFNRWYTKLSVGETICGVVSSLPEDERTILESIDVRSFFVIPVFSDGEWEGFIGFDETRYDKEWNDHDSRLLRTAAEMVGALRSVRHSREKLALSEGRIQAILEKSADIFFAATPEGVLTYVSPNWKRYLGDEYPEVVGRTFTEFIYPEDIPQCVSLVDRIVCREQGSGEIEFRLKKHDGTWRWYGVTTSVEYSDDGAVTGLIGVARDIHDRVLADVALRESEKTFRNIFDNAGEAFIIHDLEGRFLEVNEVACNRLGYTREELLNRSPAAIDSPEYAPMGEQYIQEIKRTGQSSFETVYIRRDGTRVPGEINARIVEYNGKPAIVSIERDIPVDENPSVDVSTEHYPSRTILLVGMDDADRTLAVRMLKRAGHRTIFVADVADALAVLEKEPVDSAFVEIGSPVKESLKLVSALKSGRRGERLPIIALIPRTLADSKRKAIERIVSASLELPLRNQTVFDTIARITTDSSSHS